MPNYRAVVRHVRFWRGGIHRWSTSYSFTGTWSSGPTSDDAQNLLLQDDNLCWGETNGQGGTYECSIYDVSSGGAPLVTFTRFDYLNPSGWVKYGGAQWEPGSAGFVPDAEVALLVEWAAGTSRTGKPVTFRKWYHAVPLSISTGVGDADLDAGNITKLTAAANGIKDAFAGKGLLLGSPSGRLAGLASVSAFYGNHQMPRGRKRKALAPGIYKSGGRSIVVPGPLQVD